MQEARPVKKTDGLPGTSRIDPPGEVCYASALETTMTDCLRRLYIEATSQCNLRCRMCFRNSWIDEQPGHMRQETFDSILAHLPPSVETLFFGGMGEPLFHPHIVDMVRAAHATGRRVELLSNGTLLDDACSAALLDAGLDMLWLSIDSLEDDAYGHIRRNSTLPLIRQHMAQFNERRFRLPRPVQLGMAFVAMKSNVRDLARLPYFASFYRINDVRISNVIPTDARTADELLYKNVVDWDLGGQAPLPTSPRIHVPLMDWLDEDVSHGMAGLCSSGMCDVFLSGQRLQRQARHCRFIDEGMAFVRHDGLVSPCMPLLRNSTLYWAGKTRRVAHHFFGNVLEQPLDRIWNGQDYAAFRQRVRHFEFSPCCRCSQCENWEQGREDCYGNTAPTCGACLWSEGVISCP